ncbi:MAG: hypothetical protein Q7R57_10385 [Dehalococcoidales bacterium]|nr:hypothetical protein [Dehalococcoidales bacterium]
MIALKGLLFSVFTLVLLTVISLLVVGLIKLTYKVIHKEKSPKATAK